MQGVNPAAIRKKKKGEVDMESAEMGEMPNAVTKTMKDMPILESKMPKSNPSLKSKDVVVDMDLLLQSSKKQDDKEKDDNAYEEDLGYFKVGKDKKGMFKQSGESRARYLRALKSKK